MLEELEVSADVFEVNHEVHLNLIGYLYLWYEFEQYVSIGRRCHFLHSEWNNVSFASEACRLDYLSKQIQKLADLTRLIFFLWRYCWETGNNSRINERGNSAYWWDRASIKILTFPHCQIISKLLIVRPVISFVSFIIRHTYNDDIDDIQILPAIIHN